MRRDEHLAPTLARRRTARPRYSQAAALPAAAVRAALIVLAAAGSAWAGEGVTLETAIAPQPNSSDEPLAARFSLERAVDFLDNAALAWQKDRNCMTCHTNYAFLLARPALGSDAPAHRAVRAYAEGLVAQRWPEKGPRWDAEVIMTAAVLALNDRATTGTLHPSTREALERMWTLQRDDGGFTWIDCDWPPMESDDHFGVTMAALAAGAAPEEYALTPAARAGLERIRGYFRSNPPSMLHHRMMLVWASRWVDGLVDAQERQAVIDALTALEHDDGGWGLAQLGDWQRADGTAQDTAASDGYGTGFSLFVLREAGVPVDDPRIARGVAWLLANQRESGRWFTRSLYKDNKHFITHAGTAFAVMALDACGALADRPAEAHARRDD